MNDISKIAGSDSIDRMIYLIRNRSNTKNDKLTEMTADTVSSMWEEDKDYPINHEHEKWIYTLDEENGVITLKKYNNFNVSEDVTVYPEYNVNGNIYKTKIIGEGLFDANGITDILGPTSITFIDGIDTSEMVIMRYMFRNCTCLLSVDLSTLNTSEVTNMAGMFNGCTTLLSVNINGLNTSKVTNMAQMFYNCKSIISINTSIFNTSNVTSIAGMFSGCNSLISLDLYNFDTSKVINTGMTGMFTNCESLESLNVSSFNTSNITYFSSMFSGCKSLTELDLRSWDTTKNTRSNNMFYNCEKLTKILVSSKTWKNMQDEMFYKCGCSSVTYA